MSSACSRFTTPSSRSSINSDGWRGLKRSARSCGLEIAGREIRSRRGARSRPVTSRDRPCRSLTRSRRGATTGRRDRPAVRFVLSDIAVVSVAQSAPESPEALAKVRGVDKGVARGAIGEKILAAVAEGRANDWRPPRPQKRRDDGRDIRPAVALVAAWVNQIARDRQLDPTLLATHADVEALVEETTTPAWHTAGGPGPVGRSPTGVGRCCAGLRGRQCRT